MPSSPNYTRDYKREAETAKDRGEQGTGSDSGSAERHRLRRQALKRGMVKPNQDVDHKQPLSKGGANTLTNARAESEHDNRSYPRDADGSMVVNHPKKKDR